MTQLRIFVLTLTIGLVFGFTSFSAVKSSASDTMPRQSWRELTCPTAVMPGKGADYYSFKLSSGSTVHVVVANLDSGEWRVRPLMISRTQPTSRFALDSKASAAINGGYFNLSDGESASYIVLDGKQVADPHDNKTLTGNPRLQPFLETIYKRSEIRFLKNRAGQTKIEIRGHHHPLPQGMTLVDSLQAGPELLPNLRADAEAFVRKEADGKETDSIGSKRSAARSAFGTTADGHGIFVAVSGKGQEYEATGITLGQLADIMKRLGCVQAINLDGGASTTLYVRLAKQGAGTSVDAGSGVAVCGKNPETKVRSVLLLEPIAR